MLYVDHLTKRYGSIAAVDGLSFEAGPGRVTGFLGPNGAGKTTTLRILLGLATADSGTATINGVRYRDLRDPIRSVGAALEADCFHPGRSALEHLRIMNTAAGIGQRRAAQVLDLAGLAEAGHRRVGTFSLGMRQRLALATALAIESVPSLLVRRLAHSVEPMLSRVVATARMLNQRTTSSPKALGNLTSFSR